MYFKPLNILQKIPNTYSASGIILIFIYFILNPFTWNLEQVDAYSVDGKNQESINKAKWLFVTLLVVGFVFLVIVAKYKQEHFAS
ncbi:hypothetical protein GCM10027291_00520 [Telluribacter humicola]